ncbi:hypothetical protein [Campylobacter helveticus]|uniref:hypothetical protein n=1 Tax=Campylobacter helveticus TaxID=28898 RepID=UPI001F0EFAA9|nr:hypothetical protein [Campylobacter helveticus]
MKKSIALDIFDEKGASLGKKRFYTTLDNRESINKWIKRYDDEYNFKAGLLDTRGNDFQNQQYINIKSQDFIITAHSTGFYLTPYNLIPMAVYLSVRHCIPHTWINDRDQFLSPNAKWEKDEEFQNDCLAFMLFHGQNRITSKVGINHFIPFSEKEINAAEAFESHFMQDFLQGKIKQELSLRGSGNATTKQSKNKSIDYHTAHATRNDKVKSNPLQTSLFNDELDFTPTKPLIFSNEAKEVLQAGKELFKHYHEQTRDSKDYNPNAALYDIKAHFQGFNDKGKGKEE